MGALPGELSDPQGCVRSLSGYRMPKEPNDPRPILVGLAEGCPGMISGLSEEWKPGQGDPGLIANRDDRIRTCGPFVPNEVRYQAALHPDEPTVRDRPGPLTALEPPQGPPESNQARF